MDNNLCSSLVTWLRTFPGHDNLTVTSLTDGVAMGAILHQIAPEYFTDQWLSKIRTDVADNWRLKVSNLKKIYQGVMDYFYTSDLAGQIQQFPSADLNKIAEQNDEIQLGRLLQLILGCAINCEQKQKHIEAIMGMEERTQALIVNAIQDLMNRESSPGPPDAMGTNPPSGAWLGPSSFHLQMKTLVEQLESTSLAKDDMAKRCNELDLQITILKEDKKKLSEENEKLLERLEIFESGGDIGAQRFRYKDLKKQVDTLKDELYKVESSRDEYRSRVEGLERETKELATRNEELQHLAEEARSLKDEVDALRDMSERVAVYEGTVETYKKKLEELSDLKRQVKILEEKNSEYMQQNMELEEEVKKSGTWRPQLDLYKKQVSELHQKLAEEAKKTDRQIFENKKLLERLEALTQEKERLALERDMLKENVEELKCTVSALSSPDTASRPPSDQSDIETLEIIPPEIREKIARLQHENRVLKQKMSDKSNESEPVLQSLLNDLQERHDKLLQENRHMNQQIMVLESEVEAAKSESTFQASSPTSVIPKLNGDARKIAELEKKLAEKSEKISSLEETVLKKDGEMAAMEERYKKYLSKAKSVIKTLDPKHNPGLVPDVSALRSQLTEKEKLIENMEKESEKNKLLRDVEEKLISTAFYNYGMQMHRQMIGQRLSALDNGSGQSFLSRQRQVSSRRTMNSNVSNSQYYD